MNRWTGRATVLMALLALAAGCTGGADVARQDDTTDAATADAVDAEATAEATAEEMAAEAPVPGAGIASAAGEDGAAANQDSGIGPLPDEIPPGVNERIIKEGTIGIEVPVGEFDSAFAAIVRRAQELGGDVVSSASHTTEEGIVGSVTVRVPVRNYEDLLTGVGDVGTITSRSVSSQDVTGEYVDLESRLRHLRAQEAFYLGLLEQAVAVPDAIAVQQQLNGIQAEIEQITGRLNLLDDRTSYSTLTVELAEVGAAPEPEPADEPETELTGLSRWWDTASDAFVNVVGALLVLVAFLTPIAIPALAIAATALAIVRHRRRASLATRPRRERSAAADEERAPEHDTADVG